MRKKYIELLRVHSMLAVVAIHVSLLGLTIFGSESILEEVVFLCIRNLFHFAVPCFFMISGALMLDSKKITIAYLIKKYIVRYIGVIVIFGWIFAIIEEIFICKKIEVIVIFKGFVNMIQGKSWNHMWYMYTLLGIMFIFPIIRAFVESFNRIDDREQRKIVKFLICGMFFFLSVVPLFSHLTGMTFGVEFPVSNIYMLYMLIGYWISSNKIIIKNEIALVGAILTGTIIIVSSYVQISNNVSMEYLNSYASPVVVVFSIFIYILYFNHEENYGETGTIIKILDEYSFGIYIIHMFWVNFFYKLVKVNPFMPNAIIGFGFTYLLVLSFSIISVIIMKRIPIIKKII